MASSAPIEKPQQLLTSQLSAQSLLLITPQLSFLTCRHLSENSSPIPPSRLSRPQLNPPSNCSGSSRSLVSPSETELRLGSPLDFDLLTTHRTWRSWWLGRSFRDLYFTTPSITIASLIIGVLINLKKHLRDFQSIGLCTDWFFPSRVCASQHPSSSCHYKRIITPALRWQHLLVVSL